MALLNGLSCPMTERKAVRDLSREVCKQQFQNVGRGLLLVSQSGGPSKPLGSEGNEGSQGLGREPGSQPETDCIQSTAKCQALSCT